MPRILLGIEACDEALPAAALQRAFVAAGHDLQLAWFGNEHELAAAATLGLDVRGALCAPRTGQQRAQQFAAAPRVAARLLADGSAATPAVITLGSGPFAAALANAAADEGLCVLRAKAGVRTVSGPVARDQQRRRADHAANAWCCTNEAQERELVREGMPASRVAVVGDLAAEALSALPSTTAQPLLWLAIEHDETFADPERMQSLVESVQTAAQTHHLRVRAATRGHAEAGEVAPQLTAARSARLIVTDSSGYQELAAAMHVPCVVIAGAGLRQDLLTSGANLLHAQDDDDLPHVIARALVGPAATTAAPRCAAAAVVGFVEHLLEPAAAAAGDDDRLPSDGDASGRTLGEEEVAMVATAIRSGTLNSTRGTFVATFERNFASWLGRKHVIACASGSAAVHCAIQSLGLEAGDEVVTTPITDMGALTPILYEGLVPVFADVDPRTLNVTAKTIAAQLTPRTRAIVVTHLFGLPCELDAIQALAAKHGLPLIEDAAQAFGATHRQQKVGTFGALAAFSLQQGKHITTGEGGLVATDDDDLARRVFLGVNKAWGYGDPKPDHYFPALNYRLTELQGAVATAQLPKLDWVVRRRREVAAALRDALRDLPALQLPDDPPHGTHSYWKFAFFVDPQQVPGGAMALGKRMQQSGINCVPRYIQKPAFECALFRDWRRSPVTRLPLVESARGDGSRPLFDRVDYPGALRALDEVVVLPINERYQPHHVARVADGIRSALAELSHA